MVGVRQEERTLTSGRPSRAIVDRRFSAATANTTWLTDITEHPTSEGKLYL